MLSRRRFLAAEVTLLAWSIVSDKRWTRRTDRLELIDKALEVSSVAPVWSHSDVTADDYGWGGGAVVAARLALAPDGGTSSAARNVN